MFKLHFILKSQTGICANDLNNENQVEFINLKFLLSISDLLEFHLPFSGDFKGNYAKVTMSNDDAYYINENSFAELSDAISKGSI